MVVWILAFELNVKEELLEILAFVLSF